MKTGRAGWTTWQRTLNKSSLFAVVNVHSSRWTVLYSTIILNKSAPHPFTAGAAWESLQQVHFFFGEKPFVFYVLWSILSAMEERFLLPISFLLIDLEKVFHGRWEPLQVQERFAHRLWQLKFACIYNYCQTRTLILLSVLFWIDYVELVLLKQRCVDLLKLRFFFSPFSGGEQVISMHTAV